MSLLTRIESIEALAARRGFGRRAGTLFWAVYVCPPRADNGWTSETYRPYGAAEGAWPADWWTDNCYGAEHVQAWQDRGYECVLLFNLDDYLFADFDTTPQYRAEHVLPWRGYHPGACLARVVAARLPGMQ